MASKYDVNKENISGEEYAAFQKRQKERRIRREKRAEKALRKQWKEAARNVRGMRSYGGYSMGPRLRRSFKEIKNGKYIKQRRGELQLIMKNEELQRKIKSYEAFLKSNEILSLLDGGKLKDEEKQRMENLLFNAKRKKQDLRERRRIGKLRDLINRSESEEEYKTPQKN